MKHQYFECDCNSEEHTIRFTWFEDEKDPDFAHYYMSTTLHQYRSIWKRLWIALKYIFGYECVYGHWDCTSLSKEQSRKLAEFLLSRGA